MHALAHFKQVCNTFTHTPLHLSHPYPFPLALAFVRMVLSCCSQVGGTHIILCVRVYVTMCMCARVCVCVRESVCVCARMGQPMSAGVHYAHKRTHIVCSVQRGSHRHSSVGSLCCACATVCGIPGGAYG